MNIGDIYRLHPEGYKSEYTITAILLKKIDLTCPSEYIFYDVEKSSHISFFEDTIKYEMKIETLYSGETE